MENKKNNIEEKFDEKEICLWWFPNDRDKPCVKCNGYNKSCNIYVKKSEHEKTFIKYGLNKEGDK